jgi:ATP-dependent Clp protease ATP-binding subunit ClpC
MTSNLGVRHQEPVGFDSRDDHSYEREVMSFFRPEFFNRIDSVVTFDPLSHESIRSITEKELREIGQREGLAKAELRLSWTDRLVVHIAREGFDIRYGARPLLRTLEQSVVAPLARWLVDNPQVKGAPIQLDVRETDEGHTVDVSVVG